jgi:hypothetical protein
MTELLSRFEPGEFIGLVAVAGSMLSLIIGILSGTWLKARRADIAAALKQDMLNRGMSADDIRTILEAGSKCAHRDLRSLPS